MSSKFPSKLYLWGYHSEGAISSVENQNSDSMSEAILRDESQTVGNSPLRSSSPTLNPINLIQPSNVFYPKFKNIFLIIQ